MRSSNVAKFKHGWIRPDGKFFGCGRCDHLNLLDKLGSHYTEADKQNWVKVASHMSGRSVFHLGNYETPITQAQLNTLDRFCEAHKVEMPWFTKLTQPKV